MTEGSQNNAPVAGWQFKLGVVLFALSIVVPLVGVPLVAAMGLSTATVATVSSVLLVGAEVLGILSVAVMGKEGYTFIKSRVLGFLKRYQQLDLTVVAQRDHLRLDGPFKKQRLEIGSSCVNCC